MPEKKEGATYTCLSCGEMTVCRMSSYKNNPNKLQWQNHDDNKAHFTALGECKKVAEKKTSSTDKPQINETRQAPDKNREIVNTEPTPEELLKTARELNKQSNEPMSEDTITKIYNEAAQAAVRQLVRQAGIGNIMDKAEIKHPSRVSFVHEVMENIRE